MLLVFDLAFDEFVEVEFIDNGFQIWHRVYDRSHGCRSEEEVGILYTAHLAASSIDAFLNLQGEIKLKAEAELAAQPTKYLVTIGAHYDGDTAVGEQNITFNVSGDESVMVAISKVSNHTVPIAGIDVHRGLVSPGRWLGKAFEAEWQEYDNLLP